MVSDKTETNFDTIISDAFAATKNRNVKILSPDALDEAMIKGKIARSEDDKVAAFINAYSKKIIMIDAKGEKARINVLIANSSNLPLQFIVKAGKGAEIELFEYYASVSGQEALVAPLHEIIADEGSKVEVTILHNESKNAYVAGYTKCSAKEKASVKLNFIYSGAAAVRAKNIVDADGIGSSVEVNELAVGAEDQKFDISTNITNAKQYTSARIETGAVLDDRSHCMVKGFAKVAKLAKGAKSRINERGIILSKDAHIDALPDMSIDYSDQVSATHSAATAPINKEALFYLTSRGLEEKTARKLFVTSFITKYLNGISNSAIRELAISTMLDKVDTKEYGRVNEITLRNIWSTS